MCQWRYHTLDVEALNVLRTVQGQRKSKEAGNVTPEAKISASEEDGIVLMFLVNSRFQNTGEVNDEIFRI